MTSIGWQVANELIKTKTEIVESNSLKDNPLITVSLLTYNHGKYIQQAIESVLSQKTQFSFEILLGDDNSTDETAEIIAKYQKTYPETVRIARSIENLGQHTGNGRLNYIRNIYNARGKYLALLEGDDYWSDNSKLQLQVELLESNDELSAATHDSDVLYEDTGVQKPWRDFKDQLEFQMEDLISVQCPFHTSSFVCRTKNLVDLPRLFLQVHSADFPMFMFAAKLGRIARVPRTMSVYRKNEGGITNTSAHRGTRHEFNRIFMHQQMMRYLGTHKKQFDRVIGQHSKRAIAICLKNNWIKIPATLFQLANALGIKGCLKLMSGTKA